MGPKGDISPTMAEPNECPLHPIIVSTESCSQSSGANEGEVSDTVSKRFGRLLSSEEMSDVHFIVGRASHKLKIPGHKLVLAVGSPVFKAMFYGPVVLEGDLTVQKKGCDCANQLCDIELPDVEPIAFLEFLRYLYTDEINLNRDNIVAVLSAARKYVIPGLVNACIDYLRYRVNKENALVVWQSCRTFGEEEYEYFCLQLIRRFAHYVFLSPDFLRLDHDTLCWFLKDDLIRIEEVDVFRAVARWGKNEW